MMASSKSAVPVPYRRSLNLDNRVIRDAKTYFEELCEQTRNYLTENELSEQIELNTRKTIEKFKTQNFGLPVHHFERSLRDSLSGLIVEFKKLNALRAPDNLAIGIDLGTSCSCVAVYRPGNTSGSVKIIPTNVGNKIMPSVVTYSSDGSDIVGELAKESALGDPRNTVYSVKRLIGKKINEPNVQKDIQRWPFKVVVGNNLPMIRLELNKQHKYIYPEQVSARVLKELKECAQTYLGAKVRRAVITVPAYFTDSQKMATRNAGRIAGLEVLKIINEPTAAAIAFKLDRSDREDIRKVLIYDFGGGTFDVAVLLIDRGNIEIKSVAGDMHLGGDDIDNNMVEYCLDCFYETNRIRLSNANGKEDEQKAIRRLLNACEKNKKALSFTEKVTISLDNFYDNRDLSIEITREKFKNLNRDLFIKTITIVEKALEDAGLRPQDIDDIVLVGGSTKIPKVRKILSKYFHNKELNYRINPDEAVAVGAAIQAAILNGGYGSRDSPVFQMSNVTPLALGIEIKGERFAKIIRRNTKLPTRHARLFTTTEDNQTSITIMIYEGNGKQIDDSMNLLGEFTVTDLPKRRKGKLRINVTFEVDVEGILHVKATVDKMGLETMITITERRGLLSDDEVNRLRNEMENMSINRKGNQIKLL